MQKFTRPELTTKIAEEAISIGFDDVGFARADLLAREQSELSSWLSNGFQGEMTWMEREPQKRADPRVLFPGAKSLIVVTQNYYTPYQHTDSPDLGKVSRYAWGDDYHDILKSRLFFLFEKIKEILPEVNGKVCVDTAPIMEKAWAQRAGLGWIGKHSNLITKSHGSWVFLGELILDIELEYSASFDADHCGSCTLCIDSCPTGAIVAPYMVDSNLCLSYATIELRTPDLPHEIKNNQNGWLYGCDICQDVCPWNRFSNETSVEGFSPRKDNVSPNLKSILNLTKDEYILRYRKSAMKRTKLDGLQRNARAILESNSKNIESSKKNDD